MLYKEKNYCRCCKKKELLEYLNLGKQPLANSYHKGERLPLIPLVVMLCRNCFHSQLSVVVQKEAMFKNYLYVTGTSETFRNHAKALADDAIKRVKTKKINVLDIACNDGTQLEYFRALGCDVMGVDPAENLRPITKEKHIPVLVEYWTQDIAKQMDKKFDIMTGTNVFAHVDDVDDFLKACKMVLKEKGTLILEFPYADTKVTHNEFDTVYHEHLSYFLANSFALLAKRLGFRITDVVQTPIHGGSIRFFMQKGNGNHAKKVLELIDHEGQVGLLSEKTYFDYAARVKKNKRDMRQLIEKIRKNGKKIVGYAASAKGNTMLNYFKIDLDYIVDDNDLKWGYLTPGRNIPIKSTKSLTNETKDIAIVILAWNFYNEIARRIAAVRKGKNDLMVLYVPKVEVRNFGDTNTYLQSA